MGLNKKKLKKIFRLPKAKRPQFKKPAPKGTAPHVDWAYMADMFMNKHYGRCPDGLPYGHWAKGALWDRLFPYGPRGQGYFHPSSGLLPGLGCDRANMIDLLCAPKDPRETFGAQLGKILENGTNRHVGLHVLFTGMAHYGWMGIKTAEPEVRVKDKILPVEGTLDMLVTMQTEHRYVLDFKTINDRGFGSMYKPKDQHASQLNTYMGLAEVPAGYLIYENKNNQAWATPMDKMRVDLNPTASLDQRAYMMGILSDMADGELPEYDEKVCRANKKFCSYTQVCKQNLEDDCSIRDMDHRPAEMKKRHLKVLR